MEKSNTRSLFKVGGAKTSFLFHKNGWEGGWNMLSGEMISDRVAVLKRHLDGHVDRLEMEG